MADYENGYDADLREKNVCRFCLAQDVPLTNIYSSKNSGSQVSLSMQIMACSSIEVSNFAVAIFVCLHLFCRRHEMMLAFANRSKAIVNRCIRAI